MVVRGSGWSGWVDSWRNAAEERIHLTGSAVVHRALAVEPSVHSDPGRAAELGVGPAFFRPHHGAAVGRSTGLFVIGRSSGGSGRPHPGGMVMVAGMF